MDVNKQTEYQRYNESSKQRLSVTDLNDLTTLGALNFPLYLRSPYHYYEDILNQYVVKDSKVLDLCCGDGIHTITLGKICDHVIATDIAENSIELAIMRAEALDLHSITFQKGDAENLEFADNSFDIVTCVGSISYVDLELFTSEVLRVLKPGGKFIAVDSFNYSPIYRLNRYIHYLRGERSLSTLKRMPSEYTLKYFGLRFQKIENKYFGIFAFSGSILGKLFGNPRAQKVIDELDKRMSILKRYSFKIVIIAAK